MNTKYLKCITLIAALLLVFALSGCGQQQTDTEVHPEQSAQTVSTQQATETTPASGESDSLRVEDAKAIALNHAGLTADDVVFVIANYDSDIFVPHYDIEFTADGYEYDYEISAATGTILDYDKEIDDNTSQANADSSGYITAENAKEIALQHAGLSEQEISGYESELDTEDLIPHFEIEFISGQYEYEYEINAKTGKIMFSEKERDD